MTEATWLVLTLWIVFLAFGFRIKKEHMLKTVAGIIGLLFSLGIMSEGTVMMNVTGFALLLFNVYLLFTALMIEEGK